MCHYRFWQTDLQLTEEEKQMTGIKYGKDEQDCGMEEIEETIDAISSSNLGAAASSGVEDGDLGFASETMSAETESLDTTEVEEKKTFTIRGVIDPRTDEEISLQEAIMVGIIKPGEGIYTNILTKESLPIPVAMSQGIIKVEFTSTKRTQEKKSSVGLITVKTSRENVRPYNIKSVRDTKAGKDVSREEAIKRGILDEARGFYKDNVTKKEMMIFDAIHQNLVDADYEGALTGSEISTTTYAVRAVVDTRRKVTITFHEAVSQGIINRETGAFMDTSTGESMYVGDAIMRGFLKARQIEDTNTLDIDPANKMVIDKTETIRRKLLKPLGVISALRRAAKAQEIMKQRQADQLANHH